MTVSPDRDGLLTVEDVAAILNVRPRWVYEASARGDIPRVKVGGYVRFHREDIDKWIEERKEATS